MFDTLSVESIAAPPGPSVADAPAAGAPTTGTGRRRKPSTADPEPPAVVASKPGTGRRRRTDADLLPIATESIAPVAPGSGRRRKSITDPAPVPVEVIETIAAPALTTPKPAPRVVTLVEDDSPLAPVVPIAAGRRSAGSAGHRRRARTRALAVPGAPALVAGAAAVAVAAVGAFGAAGSGSASSGSMDLARASATGLTAASVTPAQQEMLAERNAVRASRERARKALVTRQKDAAQQKAKQLAAAKALKLAKERAARLTRLAKAYRMPVQGYRLTAGFGSSAGYWSHGHTGTDFACPYGTAIRAVGSGRIISAGWDGAYGWKTVQVLNDGTEIWYAHQSKMLVKSGYVNAGDVIGRVGSTGNSTGPHLHLEVRINDRPINPIPWLKARGLMR